MATGEAAVEVVASAGNGVTFGAFDDEIASALRQNSDSLNGAVFTTDSTAFQIGDFAGGNLVIGVGLGAATSAVSAGVRIAVGNPEVIILSGKLLFTAENLILEGTMAGQAAARLKGAGTVVKEVASNAAKAPPYIQTTHLPIK